MKNIRLLLCVIAFFTLAKPSNAQQNILSKIKVYFTKPVDNSFAKGVNAVYLNGTIFDTLAAYINRAQYTVDIAQYEYKTYSGDPIANAINAAHARGVKIRYIQDGSEAPGNSGVALLNDTIPLVTSPTGGNYNIMHNKFVVIDEFSPDTTKAFLWTGSPDWDYDMSSGDYNNVIIFQSRVLAMAYTNEFNIMWGDTTHGGVPDSALAKFGQYKPNSGAHLFVIGGSTVELYFSPSDGTNSHIESTINAAKTDLYCGMFDFTESYDATEIVNRKNAGAFAAAILDEGSKGYSPYNAILPQGLGSNFVSYSNKYYLYHNKYLVVDPSSPGCFSPTVLTGSHNWTTSADTKNDENTVIVHNDTIANLYLQAFAGDFKAIKGTSLTVVTACDTTAGLNGINTVAIAEPELVLFPNPYSGSININYTLSQEANVTINVYNIMGEKVSTIINNRMTEAGSYTTHFSGGSSGVYILQMIEGNRVYTEKMVQE